MLKKVRRHKLTRVLVWVTIFTTLGSQLSPGATPPRLREPVIRSEERRVGKECRL